MDSLIDSLLKVENELRSLREQLEQKRGQILAPAVGSLERPTMSDVTPSTWREWFTRFQYKAPTSVDRYADIFPDLLTGYPEQNSPALSIQQHPRHAGQNLVLYSPQLSLVAPTEWITLELRVPEKIYSQFSEFLFTWSVSVNASQTISLWIYQKTDAGEEIRTLVDTRLYGTQSANEAYTIDNSGKASIVEMKMYFEFEPSNFRWIKIDDAHLHAQAMFRAESQAASSS